LRAASSRDALCTAEVESFLAKERSTDGEVVRRLLLIQHPSLRMVDRDGGLCPDNRPSRSAMDGLIAVVRWLRRTPSRAVSAGRVPCTAQMLDLLDGCCNGSLHGAGNRRPRSIDCLRRACTVWPRTKSEPGLPTADRSCRRARRAYPRYGRLLVPLGRWYRPVPPSGSRRPRSCSPRTAYVA
jgi:hypothetical protein